jgi:hypothetical protein
MVQDMGILQDTDTLEVIQDMDQVTVLVMVRTAKD